MIDYTNTAVSAGIIGSTALCFKVLFAGRKLIKSSVLLVQHFLICYKFYKEKLLKYIQENNQQNDLKELLMLSDKFLEQVAKMGILFSVDKKIISSLQDIIKESDYTNI